MSKSQSVAIHLARGVAGFGLLAAALSYAPALGWWTLIPLAAAVFVLRGCPMCWTLGLIATVLHRKPSCPTGSSTTAGSGPPGPRAIL